jgi:hypothetical protein
VKQVLVTPKTFPKKKHKVGAYAKSRVVIARKKIKILKGVGSVKDT